MNGPAYSIRIATAALLLPAAATGRTPTSRPASRPVLPGPVSRPALMPIQPAATVEEALAYTDAERTILKDVNDRDGTLSTPALYVLLHRAAMLPKDRKILAEADTPSAKNLWREPQRHRARLVRVKGSYLAQEDWTRDAAPTVRWGRPVHVVFLVETETGQAGRIMVMLTGPPPKGLRVGRRLELAGIYYKVVKLPAVNDETKLAEYPVVVAGRLFVGGSDGGGMSNVPLHVAVMAGLVFLLLLAFVVLLVKSRKRPAALPRGDYKPMRFEDAADAAEEVDEDGPVDPELLRQVQEYRASSGLRTDKDDADHEDDTR